MFKVIRESWKSVDLRRKIFYTIMLIVVFRFGSFIPVPFMDGSVLKAMVEQNSGNSLWGFLDTFSGGAFGNATIFAMSITPYINASIIMQLLCVAVSSLEKLAKEGGEGQKKINQITRYIATGLGFVQAIGLYFTIKASGGIVNPGWFSFTVVCLTFTAGTAFLMWLGEQINEKGIGNGISLLIFAGIVSRIPSMLTTVFTNMQLGSLKPKFIVGDSIIANWVTLFLLAAAMLFIIGAVVFMNASERKLPVNYAKRVVGRKMYGGQSTHIPIKLISAGVIPIIFAMSMMAFPGTVASFFNITESSPGFMGWLLRNVLSNSSWWYGFVYFWLIIGFTYFYTGISFNPVEISNQIKQNGGFMPGIRPGKPTSEYIKSVLGKVTIAGALFLALMAVLPIFLSSFMLFNVSLGGTSILIVVGVALDSVKQLEANLMQRNYKGFLE